MSTFERKSKIYAEFQFISFASLLITFVGFTITGFTTTFSGSLEFTITDWLVSIGQRYAWANMTHFGIISSSCLYIGLALLLTSYGIGMRIITFEDRNLVDQFFLLFIVVPLISNSFALLGGHSTKRIKVKKTIVDKESIFVEEYEKLEKTLSLKIKKELKRNPDKKMRTKLVTLNEALVEKTTEIKLEKKRGKAYAFFDKWLFGIVKHAEPQKAKSKKAAKKPLKKVKAVKH